MSMGTEATRTAVAHDVFQQNVTDSDRTASFRHCVTPLLLEYIQTLKGRQWARTVLRTDPSQRQIPREQ